MSNDSKLIIQRELQAYQCDRWGNMRPGILMNELQGMGDTHAQMLGCGRTFIHENHIAWVVTHYLVDILEMPTNGEMLTFSSWPSVQDNLRATRDFEVRGSDNRLMVRATSQWILIDLARRMPLRLREHLPTWTINETRAWNRTFDKFADFTPTNTHVMKCRFDDVDENQHINNAVYAVWATESVGYVFRNSHKLTGLEINYQREINPDTPSVMVDVLIDGNTSYHKVRTDNTIHARIICHWQPL
ncbi:MAG: hypothetical protein IJ560_03125 [Alphaproteobacteria bacterium]|nr:hypothetical protein [Alphaproteobacteria bacterium]